MLRRVLLFSASTRLFSTWNAATTSARTATSTPASSSAWSSTTRNSPGCTTSPNSSSASMKLWLPRSPSPPNTPAAPSRSPEKCLFPRNPATPSRKNTSTPSSATLRLSSITLSSHASSTTSLPTPLPRSFFKFPDRLARSPGGPHERIRKDLHERRNDRHLETRRLPSFRQVRARPRRSLQRQRSPLDQHGRRWNRSHHQTGRPVPFRRAQLFPQ